MEDLKSASKDWVRVVRCKDCVHGEPSMISGFVICTENPRRFHTVDDDYCSYGQRRPEL